MASFEQEKQILIKAAQTLEATNPSEYLEISNCIGANSDLSSILNNCFSFTRQLLLTPAALGSASTTLKTAISENTILGSGSGGDVSSNTGRIETLETDVGTLASLSTTEQSSLVGAINENTGKIGTLETNVGTLASLSTTEQSSLVGAINENFASIGTLASLSTSDKSNLVSAINENTGKIGTLETDVGTLASLSTTEQSSLVGAINELFDGGSLVTPTSNSLTGSYSSLQATYNTCISTTKAEECCFRQAIYGILNIMGASIDSATTSSYNHATLAITC